MRAFQRRLAGFLVSVPVCCGTVIRPSPETPSVRSIVALPKGWQTYRSAEYGFTIQYPKSMTSYGSHPDPAELQPSYSPICVDTTVACFEYNGRDYEGTNLEAAGLAVNVLRDMRTEQDCDQFENPPTAVTEVINGTAFRRGLTGESGLGHYEGGPSYRAFYQNVCFEIAVGIAETSLGAFDPGTVKKFNASRMDKLLDEMVRTFRFVGPVVDGAGWEPYRDTGCGGFFEYPKGSTVIVTVEYSQTGFYSNEIMCSQYFSIGGLDYTVAVKNMMDGSHLDAWLRSSGYPDLSKARVAMKSTSWIRYDAEPYYYIFGESKLYIFSVSNSKHEVVSPHGDSVFAHLVRTFK
jgi:hypothetical protein